jgi:hypothetical protein
MSSSQDLKTKGSDSSTGCVTNADTSITIGEECTRREEAFSDYQILGKDEQESF